MAADLAYGSSVSERSTMLRLCRLTCTSSRARSCPGLRCRKPLRPSRSSTTCPRSGPRKACAVVRLFSAEEPSAGALQPPDRPSPRPFWQDQSARVSRRRRSGVPRWPVVDERHGVRQSEIEVVRSHPRQRRDRDDRRAEHRGGAVDLRHRPGAELGRKILEAPAREVRDEPRIKERIWVRRSPALSKAPDRRRCAAQIACGSQTPFSLAHRRAVSYPASAWRITPVAGSFQSTRAIFSAASGVPSASRAIPECWE